MKKGMVSAVITTHNRLRYLKKAVESVKSQTYEDIEIIVVDDGSDDGTREYCKEAEVRYIYIPLKEHINGNYARNLGIKAAKGEYVAFLDDDDEWRPKKIEKQIATMTGDVGAVYVYRHFVVENGVEYDEGGGEVLAGDLSKEVFYNIVSTTSCLLFRKEALNAVGGFDEKVGYWQESDLMIRVCQKYKVVCVPEPLVLYRIFYSDQARLSNKVEGFKKAVEYINKKYAKEIDALSPAEQNKRTAMICADIANRYAIVGDKKNSRKYLRKAFMADKTVRNFAKWMLRYTFYKKHTGAR